jgi:hypothetical protein
MALGVWGGDVGPRADKRTSEVGNEGLDGMWLDLAVVLAGIVAVAVTAGVVWRL